MDQQFQELISCLGGGTSPEVCKCTSPVMAAPEKLAEIVHVQEILGGESKKYGPFTRNQWIITSVVAVVVVAVIVWVAILIYRNSTSYKSKVPSGMTEDILGLLDPLPDDLRQEAIKFYNHEFSSDLTPAEQAELKSKIMKWADSWVDYEETKKEEEIKRVRFPKETVLPVFKQDVSVAKEPVRIAKEVEVEPKKKLANLYATEDVEVSNDFGRISEKSVEVEERMKRRSEQDRLMSQQAGLPFSDEFEPKK